MIKIINLLIISLVILLSSCRSNHCDQLPKTYTSYLEAIQTIKKTHFKIQETINTSKSSWVRGASYYSCDGEYGFLILATDSQEYIHADLPIVVWNGFKNAGSFGSYYNQFIRDRYYFSPN